MFPDQFRAKEALGNFLSSDSRLYLDWKIPPDLKLFVVKAHQKFVHDPKGFAFVYCKKCCNSCAKVSVRPMSVFAS